MIFFFTNNPNIIFRGGGDCGGMARSGEGAGGGRRGRWMDRHTDLNRFAPFGWGWGLC